MNEMIVCRLTRTQKCTYNGKNHQIKGFPYSADLNMKDDIKGIKNINKMQELI